MSMQEAHTAYTKKWLALSKVLPPQELQQRLKDYWSLLANISGLTSGFAYVVSNSEVDFGDEMVGSVKRGDIYGFLITTSFLFSLGATMLASLLYAMVNILGPKGTVQFVQKFYWLCGKPLTACLLGTFFMLASQVPLVRTLYSTWVFVYTVIFGSAIIILSIFIYLKLNKGLMEMMDETISESRRDILKNADNANDIETATDTKTANVY
eukprot:436486_1